MTRLRRAVARAAMMLALVAGCAPRPTGVAPVTGGAREELYLSQLSRREQRAAMVEGAATVWARAGAACDSCPPLRLPAVQAGFVVAWPEAFRLRVGSLFGAALDVALDGDSITAYVPSQRLGLALDAGSDSLGVERPGRFATRLVSAGWRPPRPAWADGTWEGRWLVLRWAEAADSIALAVDAAGVPAWARQWRDAGRGVVIEYQRWESVDGVDWPALVEVHAPAGPLDLTLRLDRVTFPAVPDRSRFGVRIPGDAERVGPERLRGMLERAGGRR